MNNSTQASDDRQEQHQMGFMRCDHSITGLPDHQIYEVVQKHRRLRPIAPADVSGPNSALMDVTQPNWTAATQAVFAAWLPESSKANAVVASAGKTGTRASQTARTSLGRKSRKRDLLGRTPSGKTYRIRLLNLPEAGKHILSYLREGADYRQLLNQRDRSMS